MERVVGPSRTSLFSSDSGTRNCRERRIFCFGLADCKAAIPREAGGVEGFDLFERRGYDHCQG